VILTAFLFLVVPPIVEQTLRFAKTAPELVDSLSSQWRGVGAFVEQYQLQPQIDAAVASVQDQSSKWLTSLSTGIVGSVGSLFNAMAAVTIALVLAFLMLVEGPGWVKRMWGLYEDDERMKEHRALATKMHRVVTNYVNGQLSVSGIGALASGSVVFLISMFVDSVPSNLALPTIAITFVLSLIPMFGATLAGGLVALLLLVSSFPSALVFVVFFVVYQQVENNFISPLIQSKYVQLSPLAVLVAVTIGLYLFGLAGGIISIPIAGCVKVLSEYYLDTTRRKRAESKKPVQKLLKQLHVSE
jgi:predicted PurR-regulated permease PerM